MKKIVDLIKEKIKQIDFKSKKTMLLIGMFLFAIATSAILITYGAYVNTGSKNLIFGGTKAYTQNSDIELKIYKEEINASGNALGTYARTYTMPSSGYTYNASASYCSTGVSLGTFDSTNRTFDMTATQKGYCKVYFNANVTKGNFRLYVQTSVGGEYEEMLQLPDEEDYIINTTLTTCSDSNAIVTIEEGKIKVETTMDLDCDIYADIFRVQEFPYTGAVEPYTVPSTGYYKLEVWGASGGYGYESSSTYYKGGNGGYSIGTVYLTAGTTLYVYVGGVGTNGVDSSLSNGGFNGGGASAHNYGGSGGGASDIRIGTDSLYARVIVAGGGGGGAYYSGYIGGSGGGSTGAVGAGYSTTYTAKGGTQSAGGAAGGYSGYTGTAGSFGQGGASNATASSYNRSGGGGGGWYGGGGGGYRSSSSYYYYGNSGGGGGSGYVYTSSTASSCPSGCLLNSSYYMINAKTIGGNASIPTTDGTSNETGHTGNGYAKIEYLGTTAPEIEIEPQDFGYTGAAETFTVPKDGNYKLEVWGASGGYGYLTSSTYYKGGNGGYSIGTVYLTAGTTLYVYVGGVGTNYVSSSLSNGGFNGGGKSGYNNGGSGGGASDIRIGTDSLYARVIVAGGGGGGGYYTSGSRAGGYGGGTSGGAGTGYYSTRAAKGGTATAGGAGGTGGTSSTSYYTTAGSKGTFGSGGAAASASNTYNRSGGGGGGWYGGGGGGYYNNSSTYYYAVSGGGGGSGYVYTSTTASNCPSGCLLTEAYQMENAETKAGNDSTIPTTDGTSTETGHEGNGYARITLVS